MRDLLLGPYAGAGWTLALGVGLHALAWFMVSTAVPGTVAELGGAPLVAWLTTAFEGASIVAGAAGGLTKQRIGPRRAMLTAVGLFALGLVVAAAAPSMEVVLAGRLLQGLGEGLVLALSYVLIKDLFPERLVPRAFGMLAVVYAVAAFLGPVLAGLLTDLVSWRAAFAAPLLLVMVLVVLVLRVLPADAPREPAAAVPLGRLLLLAGAIFSFALTGNVSGAPAVIALALAALLALLTALWLDARAPRPLLPRTAFRPGTAVGLAYWVILLMPVAVSGSYVFTPLFLVVTFDFGVTLAGYFFSLTALAWSATALLVARVDSRAWTRRLVAIGPLLQSLGLLAVWAGFAAVGPAAVALGLASIGGGFGVSWAFLNQEVVRHTPRGEADLAAGLVPTVLTGGFALGAAFAGLLGNLGGVTDPLTAEAARAATATVFAGGLGFALLSGLAAVLLARRLRTLGVQPAAAGESPGG